jgi:hypothetical protein
VLNFIGGLPNSIEFAFFRFSLMVIDVIKLIETRNVAALIDHYDTAQFQEAVLDNLNPSTYACSLFLRIINNDLICIYNS